jgi:sugar phosphate permease
MTEAWFSPDAARLFSYLSLLSLCSLFALPAKRGQLRGMVMSIWNTAIGLGVVLVMAGVLAAVGEQPPHVTRTLLLPGFIVGLVFVVTRRGISQDYDEAEIRKTVAADLEV